MSEIYDYVVNNTVNKNVLKTLDTGNGGGGGGTSDFSIANVTCNTNATRELCMATIMEPIEEVSGLVMYPMNIAASLEHSYSVALYKGKCLTYYSGPMSSISVSGNASLIDSDGDVYVLITGDCNIALS